MTLAPLLALLALTAGADPAQGADAKASAAAASADARAASTGAENVPAVPVPPAPGGDWDARVARLEQPKTEPKVEQKSWSSLYDGTRFGLLLDVGAPDVSGVSLVFRPWRYLRLEAGGNFDLVSGGLHGGVTVLPFHWGVTPTIHAEYGHMFDGDVSGYAGSGASAANKLALKQIGYDYASTQLGLEFGAQNRFVFFVRGGLFWLWTDAKNFQQAANASNPNAIVGGQNPQIKLRAPSVNLGFLVYLF